MSWPVVLVDSGGIAVTPFMNLGVPATVADNGFGVPVTVVESSGIPVVLYGEIIVLSKSGASVSLTGSTSETALATIPIPAGALGANGVIRVSAIFGMTSSANNKSLRVRLGGLSGTIVYAAPADTTIAALKMEALIIAANATNAQISSGWAPRGTDGLITSSSNVSSSVDMTAAQDLVISGQLATGSETITLLGYIVEASV